MTGQQNKRAVLTYGLIQTAETRLNQSSWNIQRRRVEIEKSKKRYPWEEVPTPLPSGGKLWRPQLQPHIKWYVPADLPILLMGAPRAMTQLAVRCSVPVTYPDRDRPRPSVHHEEALRPSKFHLPTALSSGLRDANAYHVSVVEKLCSLAGLCVRAYSPPTVHTTLSPFCNSSRPEPPFQDGVKDGGHAGSCHEAMCIVWIYSFASQRASH
ncbi:hypothetical protein CORC01_04032 [Colletotrichum orchidophilum]|uniref:Uncharacterized protein n=1 Tax=Colletotrichum orchidophilum TaxID=1209926 RepID=A0A1G4BH60_9PEZI|nr:uncharacterized protein CORC01_04032 [Colletotrichum orchidophilum]OHF00715.1 hypothetical protein CORC01_04032 [Colletotrichum orchidophilum]